MKSLEERKAQLEAETAAKIANMARQAAGVMA
jgi:hypothetical protein